MISRKHQTISSHISYPVIPNLPKFEVNNGLNSTDIKEFMMSSIRWYKSTLSPLMPPNCRFLPTCSSYGLESIGIICI